MRRPRSWLLSCLLAIAACGPLDSGGEGSAGAPLPDGGVPFADAGVAAADAGAPPATDGGGAGGGPQSSGGQVTAVHNVKADAVRASTIYARSIKADSLRCGRVVTVSESDLPPAGRQDVHADNFAADELHAHDIDANVIEAATCYASKIDTK